MVVRGGVGVSHEPVTPENPETQLQLVSGDYLGLDAQEVVPSRLSVQGLLEIKDTHRPRVLPWGLS